MLGDLDVLENGIKNAEVTSVFIPISLKGIIQQLIYNSFLEY